MKMKLDKMEFAKLVQYLSQFGWNGEVDTLDQLIDIDVPEQQAVYPMASDIELLMGLMAQGTNKIGAIKQYRLITGEYLKESKEAVERYWISKGHYVSTEEPATLGDILSKATAERGPVNFDKFEG